MTMTENTMRAIQQDAFGGVDNLRVAQVPIPEPLPTEIRVRVHAAGINPVDLQTREGRGMAGVLGNPPFTLGWDVSGVVDALGFGVTTFEPGDEVFGMPWFPREAGAYADYVTAPSRQFVKKPEGIDHETAAAVPLAALTAWQALVDTAHLKSGQRVLVHAAAGGVGHFAVQIAAYIGATVIGTASARREAFLTGIGAQQVIDYKTARFENEIDEVDVVLDLVGSEDYGIRSVGVIRSGGLYIKVPGGPSAEVEAAATASNVRTTGFLVEPDEDSLTTIARLIDDGSIHVEIQSVFDLEDVQNAHIAAATGSMQGKIVLKVKR
ncbi:MAG: NADP-dependent oxidoreductase [Microbacteriaceae bacterium]